MTCQFATDDGAYVLGALAPADRAAFEGHLSGCTHCRESVAALAVLPGLLRRLDAATAVAVSPDRPPSVSPTLLPRTLAAAALRRSRERRRRWWFALGAAAAALCLAMIVGFVVHFADSDRPDVALTSMQPVHDRVPASAEVGVRSVPGGTLVEMRCRYADGDDGEWTLRLVVLPRSGGQPEQIGTWTAKSGQEFAIEAITHLPAYQIARVELRSDSNATLLTWSPTT